MGVMLSSAARQVQSPLNQHLTLTELACRPRATDVLEMLNFLAAQANEPSTRDLLGPVLCEEATWAAGNTEANA